MMLMIITRFPRAGRAPHVAYRPTQGLPGVKCAAGTGMVNPEYRCRMTTFLLGCNLFKMVGVESLVKQCFCRDTEQEMADMTASANPYARPAIKVFEMILDRNLISLSTNQNEELFY